MFGKNFSEQNKKEVVGSPIVAKAVCRRNNGRYDIIIVFQKSTRQEFYWRFQAKSARSSKRSWKFAGYAPRDLTLSPIYTDFSSFVQYQAAINTAQVLSVRVFQKRLLSGLLSKTANESIFANWTPAAGHQGEVSQDLVHRRGRNARAGKWAMFR